jgi:hypothetical protein
MNFQYNSSQFCDIAFLSLAVAKKENKDFSGTRYCIPQIRGPKNRQGALPPVSHI